MQKTLQIAAIENGLRLDSEQPCGRLDWLEESCRHQENFWRRLKGAADELFPVKLSSLIFTHYNFYYDFIVRNQHQQTPAFSWYEKSASEMKHISYRELGEAASVRAAAWKGFGAAPGETVCVVRNIGPDLIVDLFAALKIGCKAVVLPQQGSAYIRRRLAALDPPFIAADARAMPVLKPWKERICPEQAKSGYVGDASRDSHVYKTGCPVFAVYDPCRPEELEPVDVLADTAYLGAMRDGLVCLGLGPGQAYCAPGFDFRETFPALFMAGLLCGATYVHLKPEDVEADPQLVLKAKVKAFGVSGRVRDALTTKQVDAAGFWQSWFRNPAETSDMDAWHYFIQKANLKKSYSFNARWNPAAGGCTMMSARRKGAAHMGVLPAPGNTWQISDSTGAPSLADYGFFAPAVPGIPRSGQMIQTRDIVMRHGPELMFGGVDAVHRRGIIYPENEILEVLKAAFPGLYLSTAAVPQVDPSCPWVIVLLVFHGSKTVDQAKTAEDIVSVVATEMGNACVPDKVEFLPLYPRFLPDMRIDHEWCRARYMSGWLAIRMQSPEFKGITRIRGFLLNHENAGAGGRSGRRLEP